MDILLIVVLSFSIGIVVGVVIDRIKCKEDYDVEHHAPIPFTDKFMAEIESWNWKKGKGES